MHSRLAISNCFLIFFILISLFPAHIHMNVEANGGFVDVPAHAWYAEAVNELASIGIISGVGDRRFDPNGTVTRAQAAAFMAKAYELDLTSNVASQFRDVPAGVWYFPYVSAVAKRGFIIGSDGLYMPTTPITRAQLVTVLLRSMEVQVNPNASSSFQDIQGNFFVREINTAFQIGLTNGVTPTIFNPNGNVTRAEFATFLYKDIIYSELPAVKGEHKQPDLVAEHVSPTTVQVSHQSANQQLKFSVNHQPITLEEVEAAGYQVEFLATKNVFHSFAGTKSSTGILHANKLNTIFQGPFNQRNFQYQVVLTKGNKVLRSEVVEVVVLDFTRLASQITDYSVKRGNVGAVDIKLASHTLVTGEIYHLSDIKATLKNGVQVNHLPDHVEYVQYQSSNTNVAIVNWKGEITPIGTGNVTITITSGTATKDIHLEVKNARRVPTTLFSDTDHVKMSSVDSIGFPMEKNVTLTLVDQYGDPVYNVFPQEVLEVGQVWILQNNQTNIMVPVHLTSTNSGRTTLDGKVTLRIQPIENSSGIGSIDIYFRDSMRLAKKIDLTVSRYATPDFWRLEVKDSSRILDRHTENNLTLRLKGYSNTGIYMGDHIFSGTNSFTVKSSDTQLVQVHTNFQDIILRPGTNETRTGKATITVYNGAIALEQIEVEVVDRKPRIHQLEFRDVTISSIHNSPLYISGDIIKSLVMDTREAVSYEIVNPTTLHVRTISGHVATIKIISNVLDHNKVSSPAEFAYNEHGEVLMRNAKSGDGSFQLGDKGEIYFIVYQLRETQAHATNIITVNN